MSENLDRRPRFMFFGGIGFHVFYVRKNGDLYANGYNGSGQLSLGDTTNRNTPTLVPHFKGRTKREISSISCGKYHSLLLTVGDGVLSCGEGSEGQLSTGNTSSQLLAVPISLDGITCIIGVFSGKCSSYLLTEEGDVLSSGDNAFGELGLGDNTQRNKAEKIKNLKDIVNIVTGYYWVLFQSKDRIYSCGFNDYGQLSIENNTSQTLPVEIAFFRNKNIRIKSILSSNSTLFFHTESGQMYVCGGNRSGQQGIGNTSSCNVPVLSNGFNGFQLGWSGNGLYFEVFKKNGGLYGVGNDNSSYGYCGLGGQGDVTTPMEIKNMRGKDVVQIVHGINFTFLICSNGDVFFAGNGRDGQSMNGTFNTSKTFILVQKGLDLKTKMNDDNARISQLDGEKRMEYVNENLIKDTTIVFSNNEKVETFKSVLCRICPFRMKGNELMVPEELELEKEKELEKLFNEVLFGFDNVPCDPKIYFCLFQLFSKLHLKDYQSVLVNKLFSIDDVKFLVKFFVLGFTKLEKRNKDEINFDEIDLERDEGTNDIEFSSIINHIVFNVLSEKVEEIQSASGGTCVKILERLNVWSYLQKQEKRQSVQRIDCRFKSFRDIFVHQLKKIYENQSSSNYVIVSSDNQEISVHKEIIVTESDYFYKVIKFSGRETRREGYLLLEKLNYEELKIIVEFIYLKKLELNFKKCRDEVKLLKTVLNVLIEIIPYEEKGFQEALLTEIESIISIQIEEKRFLEKILPEIGLYFHFDNKESFTPSIKSRFINEWKKKLDEITVDRVIESSFSMYFGFRRATEESEKMDGKVMKMIESMEEKVQKKLDGIVEKNQKMEEKVQKKLDGIDEKFEQMFDEILVMLKGIQENMGSQPISKRKRDDEDDEGKDKKKRKKR